MTWDDSTLLQDDLDLNMCQSLHVHWADRLSRSLPLDSTKNTSGTTGDSFVTCQSEPEEDCSPSLLTDKCAKQVCRMLITIVKLMYLNWFLAHLSHRLKWAIVIAHRPSSVRPSSVRKLSHFQLLLWNRWTEFNETWQEARSQRNLPSLCFSADRKIKMAALASDWLRHFRLLLWNPWTEFNEIWQKARSQRPLPSLCFSGRSKKQDGRPGLWLAETFSTSPLKPLNGIQRNLTGSKISTPSTKFVFIGPIGKTRWPPCLWLA